MASRQMRREAGRGRDEMLGMLVSCIGGAGILSFVSPQLLIGPLGLVLGGFALLAILLAVVFHLKQGGSVAGALGLVLFTLALVGGTMCAIYWLCLVYLPSRPDPLSFGSISMPAAQQAAVPSPQVVDHTSTNGAVSTFQQCGTASVIEVEGLALRSAPTREAQQLAAVVQGDVVMRSCDPLVHSDDRDWQKVQYDGIEGWMSARYLDMQP